MKRLSNDPAVRLAECRGEPVPPAGGEVEVPILATVDRAHVTRLTAENARLQADSKRLAELDDQTIKQLGDRLRESQSELTKARELLGPEFIAVRRDLLNTACNGYVQEQGHALNELRKILAHQSAPAAKGSEQ